jgi:hypothetical protein
MQHNPRTDCLRSELYKFRSEQHWQIPCMQDVPRLHWQSSKIQGRGPPYQDCTSRVQRYRAHLLGFALTKSEEKAPTYHDCTGRVPRYRPHLPWLHWQSPKIQGPLTMNALAESKYTGSIYRFQDCTGRVQRFRAPNRDCKVERYRAHLPGLHWQSP